MGPGVQDVSKGPAGPTSDISVAEFTERRRRVIAAARGKGLAGVLVCARGGGALDRYGDVMYLTNHYSPFPYIPDLPGSWTGRSHSFLVLPVDADPTLIVDVPSTEIIRMPTNQVVVADLVTEAVIDVTKRTFRNGQVGLVGGDTLPVSIARSLQAALPDIEWVPADEILSKLRATKSPAEIAKLRQASKIGSRTIEAMMQAALPDATHGDVVAAGMNVLVPAGGILYNSFMASGQGGDAPTIVRSNFPTWGSKSPLVEGQWLRLGISGVCDGYFFDLSRSRPIGAATKPQVGAFEAAIAVVEAGIAAIKSGSTGGAVARAGLEKQKNMGFAWQGVFSGMGHGIGLGWDAPWLVADDTTELRPGMVLNIEKTLMKDGYLGDFEETVLLTETGTELLTDAIVRYW